MLVYLGINIDVIIFNAKNSFKNFVFLGPIKEKKGNHLFYSLNTL